MGESLRIGVVIPAAGFSSRYSEGMEFSRNKLDEDMGGRPLLQRTVELFTKHERVMSIVVAGPHEEAAFAEFRLRHGDKLGMLGASVCRGGKAHRYETVREALAHVPEDCTHIAVHDAARPCASPELIERVFEAAERFDAVVPGIEAGDTIKRVGEEREIADDDAIGAILGASRALRVRMVEGTLERAGLVMTQTPQVFRAGLLRRAYAQDDLSSTDDAQLVERLGEPVCVVRGEPRNIKVTRSGDLQVARAILGFRPPSDRPTHKKF
ncbi:MAG: 2-C-methyl-D-erythritol 4-phosphate cytidylyltransferase [Phycisphaeraceae bacterium]|nr:2-C-methyl-D-erythritol 4-phosphate cytidylyltransferase [Phycisphaeraceae bacterium]